MINILIFIICFGTSTIGAICGIGGGIIIKPLLDAFEIMSVDAISFLSGCTVLSMASYNVIKMRNNESIKVDSSIGIPLAIGAVVGGVLGKILYSLVQSMSSNMDRIGAVQAFCLVLVTIGTLLYTINKDKIRTHRIVNQWMCVLIGMGLGMISAFLGIGGGPINLVVLYFFFSMKTKVAAATSLYLICFSQLAGTATTILTGSLPEISIYILVLMIAGGLLGGKCGRHLNRKIEETFVNHLFIGLMVVIILINIYNVFCYI